MYKKSNQEKNGEKKKIFRKVTIFVVLQIKHCWSFLYIYKVKNAAGQ